MEDFWIRIREEVRGLGIYDRLMGHFWPVFLNNTICYRDKLNTICTFVQGCQN